MVEDRLDPDWPGVTFPGGHVEPGESFTQEGKAFWIKRSELENYRLPVNFDQMIQVFEDERLGEHYVHVVDGQVVRELL